MIGTFHIVIGLAAVVLGVYMIRAGRPQDGAIRPFLRNDVVRTLYIMAILALFFWGGAWAVANAVKLA